MRAKLHFLAPVSSWYPWHIFKVLRLSDFHVPNNNLRGFCMLASMPSTDRSRKRALAANPMSENPVRWATEAAGSGLVH